MAAAGLTALQPALPKSQIYFQTLRINYQTKAAVAY